MAWITYRRNAEGLDCVNTYKAECTAWCYDRVEDGKFGDQKYLDAWPERYPSLKIIEHKGFNLAIWNVNNYMMRPKNGVVMIDDDPLVFYHFASTQLLPDGTVRVPVPARGGRSKAVLDGQRHQAVRADAGEGAPSAGRAVSRAGDGKERHQIFAGGAGCRGRSKRPSVFLAAEDDALARKSSDRENRIRQLGESVASAISYSFNICTTS